MGRKDTEEMSAAQIFYPCMQCADVFFLKADICQLGMDQRKVNMLARCVQCLVLTCFLSSYTLLLCARRFASRIYLQWPILLEKPQLVVLMSNLSPV